MINITPFNYSQQVNLIQNLTNLTKGGPVLIVQQFIQPIDYFFTVIVLLLTVGITYIKTQSPAAVAYVTLLLSALFATFVPHTTLKIAYILLVFAMAAMLYAIYKSW